MTTKDVATRGPVPKRSSESAGHKGAAQKPDTIRAQGAVSVPPADPSWAAEAIAWYRSLAVSGQSRYYEPSDWAYAQIVGAMLSQLFEEPSAALFNAVSTAMADLGTTEGARRRLRIEVERDSPAPAPAGTQADRLKLLAGGG